MPDRVYDGVLLDEVYVVLDISSQTKDMPAHSKECRVFTHGSLTSEDLFELLCGCMQALQNEGELALTWVKEPTQTCLIQHRNHRGRHRGVTAVPPAGLHPPILQPLCNACRNAP